MLTPFGVIVPILVPFTYSVHEATPPLSETVADKETAVPAVAVLGEMAPTVGAVVSVVLELVAAETVTVVDAPEVVLPAASSQLA